MSLRRRPLLLLALTPMILLSLVTAVLAQRMASTKSCELVVVDPASPFCRLKALSGAAVVARRPRQRPPWVPAA